MGAKSIAKLGGLGAVILGVIGIILLKSIIPLYIEISKPEELDIVAGNVELYRNGRDVGLALEYPEDGELAVELYLGDPDKLMEIEDIKSLVNPLTYANSKNFRFMLEDNPKIYRTSDFRIVDKLNDILDFGSRVEMGILDDNGTTNYRYIKVDDNIIFENKEGKEGLIIVAAIVTILALLLIIYSISYFIKLIREKQNSKN